MHDREDLPLLRYAQCGVHSWMGPVPGRLGAEPQRNTLGEGCAQGLPCGRGGNYSYLARDRRRDPPPQTGFRTDSSSGL